MSLHPRPDPFTTGTVHLDDCEDGDEIVLYHLYNGDWVTELSAATLDTVPAADNGAITAVAVRFLVVATSQVEVFHSPGLAADPTDELLLRRLEKSVDAARKKHPSNGKT